MEAELETQLTASEKRNSDLKNQNQRLQTENDHLKLKLANLTGQTGDQIGELQRQLNETQISNAKLTRCIRELEQSNDDLERAKRALHASLDDFEKKLNHQIEKNVLLENELGEKEQLEEIIQRLKDETRDLKQELLVQQQPLSSNLNNLTSYDVVGKDELEQPNKKKNSNEHQQAQLKSSTSSHLRPSTLYSFANSDSKQTQIQNHNKSAKLIDSQLNSNQSTNNTNNLSSSCSLLSPSTRISLLNIVSDLLRKVGALESRLNQTSCKTNIGQTNSQLNNHQVNSPIKNGHCQNGNFN